MYRQVTSIPYPPLSQEKGEEGTVIWGALVSPEGKLDSVKVVESSGSHRLDKAARKGVMGNIFLPRVQNGKPVWSQVNIPISFRLEDEDVQN